VNWKRHLAYGVISIVGGFIFGFIAGILCTPILWKLEPILNIELAGHSGPADWVMFFFFGASAIAIEFLLVFSYRRSRRAAAKNANSGAL
jgi:hypothetical protein